jgi:hypothetical protein
MDLWQEKKPRAGGARFPEEELKTGKSLPFNL